MATILLNGLFKDYSPPGGIATYGTLANAMVFDPTAQAWTTGRTVACPQGDSGGVLASFVDIANVPFDGGFSPRVGQGDDGLYATVASTVGGRFFSTNIKTKGTTSGVEPTTSGLDNQVFWQEALSYWGWVWRGARVNTTAYVVGDLISTGGFVFRCIVGGTSSGSLPGAYASAAIGGTVSDGGTFFFKFGVAGGAWAGATTITGATPQDTNQHAAPLCLTTTGSKLLIWGGIRGTNATTGGAEPAWTAATAGQKYWADNDILWIQGKDLFGNTGAAQAERLILTGLAAGSNNQLVTITNTGASTTDVVLADKTGAVNLGLVGSDMESSATNKLDCSGANVRIPGGSSADFKYSTGTGLWVYQPAAVVGGGIHVLRRRRP